MKSESIKFDENTLPKCRIEEKKHSWGEPYTVITPLFDLNADSKLNGIEYFIEVYGKNNFKVQLLRIYNKITNFEENTGIKNYTGDRISKKLRHKLLNRINKFLKANNDRISPWELYEDYYKEEMDYVKVLEREIGRDILYVEKE